MAHATIKKESGGPRPIVIDTLPILGYLAYVQFHSGSTHSFIAEEFVRQAKSKLESLEISFTISTPAVIYLPSHTKSEGWRDFNIRQMPRGNIESLRHDRL